MVSMKNICQEEGEKDYSYITMGYKKQRKAGQTNY
jgi:hypothetical protein